MVDKLIVKSLDSPDETTVFENGQVENTQIEDVTFMLGTVEPGWLWSRDNGPDPGPESCPQAHRLHMLSGQITVEMDDGTRETLSEGDIALIPPGHDAWTEGDEQAVFLDVQL